jgi:hypothetical protein
MESRARSAGILLEVAPMCTPHASSVPAPTFASHSELGFDVGCCEHLRWRDMKEQGTLPSVEEEGGQEVPWLGLRRPEWPSLLRFPLSRCHPATQHKPYLTDDIWWVGGFARLSRSTIAVVPLGLHSLTMLYLARLSHATTASPSPGAKCGRGGSGPEAKQEGY